MNHKYAIAFAAVSEFISAIFVCAFLGYLGDEKIWYSTSQLGVVFGTLVGFVLGFYRLYRVFSKWY